MNDQGYTYLASGCSDCRVYKGDKAIRPAFIITERHGHRYWTCPMCEGSYGEVEPQPQAVTEDARDGERYRWLRGQATVQLMTDTRDFIVISDMTADEKDAAIDAARRVQTSSGKGAE